MELHIKLTQKIIMRKKVQNIKKKERKEKKKIDKKK